MKIVSQSPKYSSVILLSYILIIFNFSARAQDNISFNLSENTIDITSFYHGSALTADIVCPQKCEIAIKLTGEKTAFTLNRKGKISILWMNVGEVEVKNTPQVYILYSSKAADKLAPLEKLAELGIGYNALEKEIEIETNGVDREKMIREFFKFKQNTGLYSVSVISEKPSAGSGENVHYSVPVQVSSVIPPGSYSVQLYCFYPDGHVEKREEKLSIEKKGFIEFISGLATEHGAVYGVLAVIIAIITGFAIGIIFNFLKKRKH